MSTGVFTAVMAALVGQGLLKLALERIMLSEKLLTQSPLSARQSIIKFSPTHCHMKCAQQFVTVPSEALLTHYEGGTCVSWRLESGDSYPDYGLDYGLDSGLDSGLDCMGPG